MLTAEQIAYLRDRAIHLSDPINDFLLDDIARRLQSAGQFTSTAAYQIWVAQELGKSRKEIETGLRLRLGATKKELRQLLTQTAEVGYNFDISKLPRRAVQFENNHGLQNIVNALVKTVGDQMENLTQTLGMTGPGGRPLPLQQAYREMMDCTFTQVITGATDYNTAIRTATKHLAEKGVVTIDYESGVHTSLEAAVRRNVMGGLGLLQEQISQTVHDDMGCDGWEISAHANSAPDHEPLQGKQYTDAEYEKLNRSLHRRIGTLNCGHVAFPIILGVQLQQYSTEELEKFRQENDSGVDYEGRHYSGYEATQRQRTLERGIRVQKRRILLAESSGDEDTLTQRQIKLRCLEQEYERFCKGTGLRTEYERAQVASFGRSVARKAQATVRNPKVRELSGWRVKDTYYAVDGRWVVQDHDAQEKSIAELLRDEMHVNVGLVPRVNYPQGVTTPDYLVDEKSFDLKTLGKDAGENTMWNRLKKAKRQARNFVVDISAALRITDEIVDEQLNRIFSDSETEFVEEIVVIREGRILRREKRA